MDNKIIFKTKVKSKHFESDFCSELFLTMLRIVEKNLVIDEMTIVQVNKDISIRDLLDLPNVPTSKNWKFYEERVIQGYNKREIITACEQVINNTYDTPESMISILMDVIDKTQSANDAQILDIKQVLDITITRIEEARNANSAILGITTGFPTLDKHTSGFRNGRFYVIGAKPSVGKSLSMINFALNCNVTFGVFSAESGVDEIGTRMLSRESRINGTKLASGYITASDTTCMYEACDKLISRRGYFYDQPNMGIDELTLKAYEMKRRFGVEIIFIDYLQILQNEKNISRHEQVADISLRLKNLSRKLDIPVVALAQLRRNEKNPFAEPNIESLADSSQIERDADVLVFIHRWEDEDTEEYRHKFIIAKNRDGQIGDIFIKMKPEHYTIREIEGDNR